jgi:hypothetical protein
MTAEQFVYWLQGFIEIADPKELNKTQTTQIKNHLKLVFDKKTPDVNLPMIQREEPFRITPYQITCDDNNNFPDLMTTPVCSTTTITTTPLDPDIQKALNGFARESKTESKRQKFPGLKC